MRKALMLLCVSLAATAAGHALAQSNYDLEQARLRLEREQRDQDARDTEFNRKRAEESQAALRANRKAVEELLATVRTLPVLPAARNPLIGKWVTEASRQPQPKADSAAALFSMLQSGGCKVMFSDGVARFGATDWSMDDADGDDNLGPVTYRGKGDLVFVLPAKGMEIMAFKVEGPDRIVEQLSPNMQPCILTRVPQTTTYATRPRPPRAATAQTAAAAAAGRPDLSGVPRAFGGTAAGPAKQGPKSARGQALMASIPPGSLLAKGVALHQSGFEYQEALPVLQAAARQTPNDARVHAFLADTYFRLGMRTEGAAADARARQLDPTVFEVFN